ncbi:MAG: peptidoglycan editing factor PgeF [Pseudoxanthomonas sp.]
MSAVLQARWPVLANVRAFTTLRHGAGVSAAPFDEFNLGARCGDDAQAVAANRAALIEACALPSPPNWLQQVHGTEVVRISAPVSKAARAGDGEPVADASVTSTAGVVLAILTADCLPVVLAAEDGGEIAAAHAGWRGLASGVLENTVAAMHAPAGKLVAWLGPAAGPQAYEIGEEVFEAFVAQDARAASAFIATRPGHWRVDLYGLARQRLAGLGITRVHGGDLCTISDAQHFYSHRRSTSEGSGRTGRMATLVWMQP